MATRGQSDISFRKGIITASKSHEVMTKMKKVINGGGGIVNLWSSFQKVSEFLVSYLLTYLSGLRPCSTFLGGWIFAILSASLQALRFEVKSFDNFKDFKSQLTHCCQVFPGQPRSRLPATSCCVHFFMQPSL